MGHDYQTIPDMTADESVQFTSPAAFGAEAPPPAAVAAGTPAYAPAPAYAPTPAYAPPPAYAGVPAHAYAPAPGYAGQPMPEVMVAPVAVEVGPDAGKEAEASSYVALMEMSVRKAFLRKVFTLVFLAFGINMVFCAIACLCGSSIYWMYENVPFMVTCAILPIILVIPMFCCRKNPKVALPLFFGFAASYSPFLMVLAAEYPSTVTMAFASMFLIAGGIAAIATQPWFNISFALIGLLAIVIAFPFMWIPLLWHWNAITIAYCCLGLVASCLYFMIDIWFAMKVLSIDEYIIAAIQMYLDLLRVLIYLVQLIAASK